MRKLMRWLLGLEAIICFATPGYALFLGWITMPVWIGQIGREAFLWLYLAYVVAGSMGLSAVFQSFRYSTARTQDTSFPALRVGVLSFVGVVALWALPSSNFSELQLDFATFMFAILPTFGGIQFYVLALLRSRKLSGR